MTFISYFLEIWKDNGMEQNSELPVGVIGAGPVGLPRLRISLPVASAP
jgi:hypothetical protein